MQKTYTAKLQEHTGKDTTISRCLEKIEARTQELEQQEKQYRFYQTEYYTVTKRAVEAYEKYLENDGKGPGGSWPRRQGTCPQKY